MTASERLEAIIKQLRVNVKTLSDLCGYERPQAFYDIQKGKTRNISPTVCEKIMGVLPNISKIWLMTGEGPMFVEKTRESVERPEEEDRASKSHYVPLVPLSAIAGPIKAYYEDGVNLAHCQKILSPVANAEMAIQITGDSMEPQFQDGSLAFIKRINESAFIPWGQPMVVDTENGVFIKVILPGLTDDTVQAESYNPKYPAMTIPKTSIYGMYRVLSVSKYFLAQ